MSSLLRSSRKQGSLDVNPPKFRVAVFGQAGVGKTAFIVRFVTKKFIGEYDPTLEVIYERSLVDPQGNPVFFEIMDTQGQEENTDILIEKIKWADAFILLYSITDRVSFKELVRLKFLISHTINSGSQRVADDVPITMVGNKLDLQDVERMVSHEEGTQLASSLGCYFYEVSVRESVEAVSTVFESMYKHYRSSGAKCAQPWSKSGQGTFDPHRHHFPAKPTKRKNKSFKYVDRMPRIQASSNISRPVSRQFDELSITSQSTPFLNFKRSSEISISKIPGVPLNHHDKPRSQEAAEIEKIPRNKVQEILHISTRVDDERHSVNKSFITETSDDAAESTSNDAVDEGEESSYDNSSSDSCVEDEEDPHVEHLHYQNVEAKRIAKDFFKKTMQLSFN